MSQRSTANTVSGGQRRNLLRIAVTVVTLLFTLIVNGLANALPINDISTGEIADLFPVYFIPENYVFGIWGVIYLLLIGFTVHQARPSQQDNRLIQRVGYWFALSNILNGVWIFTWHYLQFTLSLVIMTALLLTLIVIYLRTRGEASTVDKWLIQIPFSVYLGWISVATIANATSVLYDLGWDGFGIAPDVWGAVLIVVTALLGLFFILRFRDVTYIFVLVWALVGLAVKQLNAPTAPTEGVITASNTVLIAAVAAAIFLLVALAVRYFGGSSGDQQDTSDWQAAAAG